MYGWRGRIGYISPAPVDSVAYEFYRMVPEGVVLVTNSLMMQKITMENIRKTQDATLGAARDLADAGAQFIISSGGPAITTKGVGYDREVIKAIREHTGLPATTTTTAALDALRAVGAKKLAVATPYVPEFAQKLKEFLEASGFAVAGITTMSKQSNYELSLVPEYVPYQHAKQTYLQAAEADALYIPCARWPAIAIIDRLESDLQVPVVTSLQATIWAALRGLHIKQKIAGYGRLLELS